LLNFDDGSSYGNILWGLTLPVKAHQLVWVRAQQLDYFKVRGVVPPGSFSNKDQQNPATIRVSKSGKGVVEKKETTSKLGQGAGNWADEKTAKHL
jgi:hypothetical protein